MKLVIPTYRMRDIHGVVKAYDENLDTYGHQIPIIIFSDEKQI